MEKIGLDLTFDERLEDRSLLDRQNNLNVSESNRRSAYRRSFYVKPNQETVKNIQDTRSEEFVHGEFSKRYSDVKWAFI